MSIFPKAKVDRPLEIGQHIVIDVSQVPEIKKYYRPGIKDVDFKLIQILNYESGTFYVVSDGMNLFSIEMEMPDNNAEARGFLDDEY